jgi:chemotaxis protein methyltransferase WspC
MISAIDLSALQGVESLLRQRIGLAPESLGTAIIQDAVQLRMRARHISDWSAFEHLVREDLIAFQELVEQIVVPETWFFRDLTPFDCLRFFVRTWKNADPPRAGQRLRLLSVPCSTGEEAYSLAIALLDEGLNAAQFQVEGVDISRPTLRRAREATYGENSFRQAAPPLLVLRERYFRRRETQYEVCDEVRRSVNFQLDNLASPRFLAGAPSFDVIFCRNLLIYLDAPARRTALAHFQRLLAPGGLLYVGHVEGAVVSAGD